MHQVKQQICQVCSDFGDNILAPLFFKKSEIFQNSALQNRHYGKKIATPGNPVCKQSLVSEVSIKRFTTMPRNLDNQAEVEVNHGGQN